MSELVPSRQFQLSDLPGYTYDHDPAGWATPWQPTMPLQFTIPRSYVEATDQFPPAIKGFASLREVFLHAEIDNEQGHWMGRVADAPPMRLSEFSNRWQRGAAITIETPDGVRRQGVLSGHVFPLLAQETQRFAYVYQSRAWTFAQTHSMLYKRADRNTPLTAYLGAPLSRGLGIAAAEGFRIDGTGVAGIVIHPESPDQNPQKIRVLGQPEGFIFNQQPLSVLVGLRHGVPTVETMYLGRLAAIGEDSFNRFLADARAPKSLRQHDDRLQRIHWGLREMALRTEISNPINQPGGQSTPELGG